ncbi:MAG TPA: type II toxin-antitoxin system HipA family toxin [Ohtaekwangia sp.]|nr:type II toxin-antitoxin system HipA family toxin [Ohtaekwangia sp.]
MTRTLDVYLHGSLTGHLIQDDHGQTLFEYIPDWLKNPNAIPLSISLPLQAGKFEEKYCKPFFAGVLPDNAKRKLIARNLGISANNDFSMLEQIGGECAGAITFLSTGTKLSDNSGNYRSLSSAELEKILFELPKRPLMAGESGVRLSLAGAQDKIAVYKKDGQLFLPLGNAPSSHIIKPDIEEYKGIVFNEAFCMKLATHMGFPVAPIATEKAGNIDYLLIERYDRVSKAADDKSVLDRIHQEDFCQALGIVSERKYQAEGGPSIKDCFDLLRKISSVPVVDLGHLLDAVIFNFLIGNHDAHGKNFSLLYRTPDNSASFGKVRLAPLYDLICTPVYSNLSKKMAMKIGKAYELSDVDPRQFEKLADDIGFTKSLVKRKVIDHAKKLLQLIDKVQITHPVTDEIRKFINDHCSTVLDRFTNDESKKQVVKQ